MKKLQIIILTLLIIFNLQFDIYALPEGITKEDLTKYHVTIIKKNPSLEGQKPNGVYFIYGHLGSGHFGYIPLLYYGIKPRFVYDVDKDIYKVEHDELTFSKNGNVAVLSSFTKEQVEKFQNYIYNGSDFITDNTSGGGSTTPDGGNNQDGNTQGLGILNNINNTINSLVRNINSLLSSITNVIKKAVTDILEGIKKILKEFLELLKNILKELFLPEENYINNKFTELKNLLTSKFNLSFIEQSTNQLKNANTSLFNDVYYNNVKVIDMSFLNNSIPHIKKYTDGFFWLLFILFQYNEIYFLIRGTKSVSTSKE